jgi:RNA polymerase sigma-70 factor (ECF subfamily)
MWKVADLRLQIELAKAGDDSAKTEIYTELYTPIFKYTLSRTRDRALAEDITSEVFFKFLKSLPEYTSQTESPLPYLYTIARNLIINHGLKKKSEHLPDEASEYIPDGKISQLEESSQREEVALVLQTLSLLPDDQAEVIRLRYLSELTTEEIAGTLNKTLVNVRKLESRGLAKLRTLLNSHE